MAHQESRREPRSSGRVHERRCASWSSSVAPAASTSAMASNATATMRPTDIATVATLSTLKVVIAILLSAALYRQLLRRGAVQELMLKQMSQVNRDVMVPLFIFTQTSKGVTAELLAHVGMVVIAA